MINSIKIKIISLFMMSIWLGGIFIGCKSKMDGENTQVRIGYFPNITHSQALVGRATGEFQKAFGDKNKIDWKLFNAGAAEIEALLAGEIDLAYIGPGPAINGYAKSKGELQIIANAVNSGAIFVSRKDIKINEIKELSGKKIVIPQFGNTQDLCLRHILKENKLMDASKGGTVEILQSENPNIKTLLDRGDVDAALVPEPWGSRLIKEVNANVILDYKDIWRDGNYTSAVLIVRTEFLKENPDIVEKFVETHVAITDYINNNINEAKDIINGQLKELTQKPLDKDILDQSFKRLIVTNSLDKESIQDFAKLYVEAGFLRKEPDINSLFNFDIINKILKEKGETEKNNEK